MLITLQIDRYQCVYLWYQSQDDWKENRDILRCNPSFYGVPRYDCCLINMDSPHPSAGRIRSLFRCRLPSGRAFDVALVTMLKPSRWKPRTYWDGCRVYEEAIDSSTSLVLMKYIVRGALVSPAFDSGKPRHGYLIDTIDGDMYLRLNSIGI